MPARPKPKTIKAKTISSYPKGKTAQINSLITQAKKLGMNTNGIFTNKTDIPSLEKSLKTFLNKNSKK